MKKIPPLLLILLLTRCSGCDVLPTPKEELPPIIKEGKNTFGCLVNGKLWLPKGNNGTSNLDLSYDPTYDGGTLDIASYRILSDQDRQYLYIYMTNLSKAGIYKLNDLKVGSATFDYSIKCNYNRDSSVYRNGILDVTKFDLLSKIISGTFEFSLVRSSCDTLKVTQGRFDMKF